MSSSFVLDKKIESQNLWFFKGNNYKSIIYFPGCQAVLDSLDSILADKQDKTTSLMNLG